MRFPYQIKNVRTVALWETLSAAVAPCMGWLGAVVIAVAGYLGDLPSWVLLCLALGVGLAVTLFMHYRAHRQMMAAIDASTEEIMRGLQPEFVEVARTELRTVFQARTEEINQQVVDVIARNFAYTLAFALTMTPEERARMEQERRATVERTMQMVDEASGGMLSQLLEEREARAVATAAPPSAPGS